MFLSLIIILLTLALHIQTAFYFFPVASLLFFASIFYSIIKHNIFETDPAIIRGITYALTTLIITVIYVLILSTFNLLLGRFEFSQSPLFPFIFALIIVFVFSPLRDRVRNFIDQTLNRERIRFREVIKKASEEVISILNLDDLLNKLVNTVSEAIQVERASIMIADPQGGNFSLARERITQSIPPKNSTIEKNDPLLNFIRNNKNRALIKKEIEDVKKYEAVRKTMEQMGAELCAPLVYQDKIIGLFNLGSKLSGEGYISEDIEILNPLSKQAAVAMENCRLIEEQRDLQARVIRYQEMDKLKSDFLSNVSHELRTPMTSVKAYSTILLDEIDELDRDNQEKFLNIIIKESDRLIRLISDLLDLQKIEAGKIEWKYEDINLSDLLKETVEVFSGGARDKKIEIIERVEAKLPIISGDRDRLFQVITNLLSNAIKFSPEGGRIVVSAEANLDEILISVKDNGRGIPEDMRERIFDRFQQVDNSAWEKTKGTGLGLAIAKEIVEHHKGRIWVESELNKGSDFKISLPYGKR
ncbi:MAG: GAF domain-containing protein [Deltaproteobacteria bacterium]|nr:MAG: GAF domain-containing protein [Deltaproteobacteria bacterium]